MVNVAVNVRNRIIRYSFKSNLYYQLSALQEQCQKEIWTEKEIREKITFLSRVKDLRIENLRKIRTEIRESLIEIIRKNVDIYTDYTLAKLIYGVYCISYQSEGFKGLDERNSKILFSIKYINLVEKAAEKPEQIKNEIENLILLDG